MPRPHYTDGGPIDLAAEEVILASGARLTDELAERIVEDVHTKVGRGRPSLTAPGARSPQLRVTVSDSLRERLTKQAAAEGRSLSTVAREALERYLAS